MYACMCVCMYVYMFVAIFVLEMHPKCIYDGFRYGMYAGNNMSNKKDINHI